MLQTYRLIGPSELRPHLLFAAARLASDAPVPNAVTRLAAHPHKVHALTTKSGAN